MNANQIQSKIVVGHGAEISPIMIVSDYPTKEEWDIGKALTGHTGSTVESFLRSNSWSLTQCYKTCYIKTQVPGFESKNKERSTNALAEAYKIANWSQILNQEINEIKPNVIIALGELPMRHLTGEKGLHNFRGSILPIKPAISDAPIKVIPTYHPRDLVADESRTVYLGIDYQRAVKYKNLKSEYTDSSNLWICRTAGALIEYWKRAKEGRFLTLDIEIWYNYITCIGFCTDGKEAISIPLLDKDMSNLEKLCLWKKIQEILESKIPKVGQNIKYDWTMLERYGLKINNIIGDTMLKAHTLYAELPKCLNFLTSIYTDIPYYKDEGKDYDPKIHDFERMLYYNAKDCLATWRVWEGQLGDAKDLNLENFYNEKVQPLFFHYKKIDDRGIRIDEAKRLNLFDKYIEILYNEQAELTEFYGQNLNTASPMQVSEFVYEFLKCPKHYHTAPNGNQVLSTDEDTIEEIFLNEISDDLRTKYLKKILFCRKIDKILEFLNRNIHLDGRMRCSYKVHGTENGRTSGGEYIGWYFTWKNKKYKAEKLGTSFQTIPKHGFEHEEKRYGHDIREMFVPSPGYAFVDADGSNAEGHVVAVLSEDWEMLDYMEKGGDIHKLTASWIYLKPPQLIKKPSDERDIGKMARHAGNLGQGANGLAIQIHKSFAFCSTVIERFHKNAPKVRGVFHDSILRIIKGSKAKRFLISPHGRRRDFFGRVDAHMEKEAFSFLPQSTVSDHYKLASLRIAQRTEIELKAQQLFEAHDGLMWECPVGNIEQLARIAYEEMAAPINFSECTLKRDYELKIPVELGSSTTNWKEMKDLIPK